MKPSLPCSVKMSPRRRSTAHYAVAVADPQVTLGDLLPEPSDPSDASDVVWRQYAAQFAEYSRGARNTRIYYQVSQGLILLSAALITLSASLSVDLWVPATLGVLITVLGGAQQLFRWQANWIQYRQAAEEMRQHGFAFVARTAPYGGADRRELLAEHRRRVAQRENSGWAVRMTQKSSADGAA